MTVAPKFKGSPDQRIDAKGRVSIPADFRKIAEQCDPDYRAPVKPAENQAETKGHPARLTLVYGEPDQPFLECYSVQGMADIAARIDRMDIGSDDREDAELHYYSHSTDVEIDADGRIVLPLDLRDKLQVAEKLLFIGKGDRFEIWNPATYGALKSAPGQSVADRRGPNFNFRKLLHSAGQE